MSSNQDLNLEWFLTMVYNAYFRGRRDALAGGPSFNSMTHRVHLEVGQQLFDEFSKLIDDIGHKYFEWADMPIRFKQATMSVNPKATHPYDVKIKIVDAPQT